MRALPVGESHALNPIGATSAEKKAERFPTVCCPHLAPESRNAGISIQSRSTLVVADTTTWSDLAQRRSAHGPPRTLPDEP
jgi:hypothetical protein